MTNATMRQAWVRRFGRAALLGAVIASALATLAPLAHAVVVNEHGHGYGVTPLHGVAPASIPGAPSSAPRSAVQPFAQASGLLLYKGGPVMHSVTSHLIYWDPAEEFTATTKGIFAAFFAGVASASGLPSDVFAIGGQYTDGTGNAAYGAIFAGEMLDKASYPTGGCSVPAEGDQGPPYTHCISDEQLQRHLARYVAEHGLPTGPAQQYFVLTPHKVVTCLSEGVCSNNYYCAYHGAINPGTTGEIIYADIPFTLLDGNAKACQADGHAVLQHPNGDTGGSNLTTRYADVALKYTSHEYMEAATDPLPETDTAWVDKKGQEIGDKCNATGSEKNEGYDPNAFLPVLGGSVNEGTLFDQLIAGHGYYLQSEWDNASDACLMQPAPITGAAFSANAGPGVAARVSFNGVAADPYASPVYSWNFGDGGTASGPAPSHTYPAPGAYQVTMTVTDTLTDVSAAVTQTVNVGQALAAAGTATQPSPFIPSTTSSVPATTPAPATASSSPAALTPPRVAAVAASFSRASGAITITGTMSAASSVSWLATFPNGIFGAFTSATHGCGANRLRIHGKCRPSRILYGRGRAAAPAGSFRILIKPTPSAVRALKVAFRRGRPLPVTIGLTFQPSQGGSTSSQTRVVLVRLKHA